jgi:hypothetical protein
MVTQNTVTKPDTRNIHSPLPADLANEDQKTNLTEQKNSRFVRKVGQKLTTGLIKHELQQVSVPERTER